MKRNKLGFILVAALAAAPACKDDGKDAGDETAQEQPAEPPVIPEAPASPAGRATADQGAATADDAASPESYEISATQIGPLQAGMPATVEHLQKLFPEATVTAATESAEGQDDEIVEVTIGDEDALTVSPGEDGNVARVRIESPRFRTGSGAGLGSTLEDVRELGTLACLGGADRYGDSILCRPEKASELAFVFPAGDVDDYYAKPVPAEAQARILSGKKVEAILWQPAR